MLENKLGSLTKQKLFTAERFLDFYFKRQNENPFLREMHKCLSQCQNISFRDSSWFAGCSVHKAMRASGFNIHSIIKRRINLAQIGRSLSPFSPWPQHKLSFVIILNAIYYLSLKNVTNPSTLQWGIMTNILTRSENAQEFNWPQTASDVKNLFIYFDRILERCLDRSMTSRWNEMNYKPRVIYKLILFKKASPKR